MIDSLGNLSGFFGPAIVGWASAVMGGTGAAILLLAGTMCLASGLTFSTPAKLVER